LSGHSKWASIKHKKQAQDAKRGKLFTKLIREITVAAREGGGNPDTNPRLRQAIERAKEANMPQENIIRAIKRGTGEIPGVSYEQVIYECYGPQGVAILIEALTDNKNRTSAEIRSILTKKGGNMASPGAVSWMFQRKGYILVEKDKVDEETLMEVSIEAGAEDIKSEGKNYEIITSPQDFEKVKNSLKEKNIPISSAEITMIPTSTIRVTGQAAKQVLALVESLEDHDDVQNVYSNFDIPEEELESLAQSLKE